MLSAQLGAPHRRAAVGVAIWSCRWRLIAALWEVYTREQFPQYWAVDPEQSRQLRSPMLAQRSEGPQSAANLELSLAAYRSALEVYTREQFPQYWATTQTNLGTALTNLAEQSEGAGRRAAAYLQRSCGCLSQCATSLHPRAPTAELGDNAGQSGQRTPPICPCAMR